MTPVYLNYLNVARTLNEVASTYGSDANPPSLSTIRESISEHFTVDEVNYPTVNDIQITRNGSGWHLEAAYDDYAPLFGPVSLQIQFDKTVTFGNGG